MTGSDQARQAFGARLRELRRDARLTGLDLAARLNWHSSKVSRLEHGKQVPSDDDIRDWCVATGAELLVPDLLASARNVRAAYIEWRRLHAGGHRHRQRKVAELESGARLLRWFEPALVPGLLQTREYAAAILRACIDLLDTGVDDLDAAVDARMERQAVLGAPGREFRFVLGEQVLYSTVGDERVMAGQLDHLLGTLDIGRVGVGVIPRAAEFGVPSTNFLMFDRGLVMVETVSAGLSVTTPSEIALYERTFAALAARAVYGGKARALIAAARAGRP
ncbi:helix-turn-helix domain-containing protein [Nocardia testacea]|uniref:helix-turn-helix domain-containing protein n=1 Tax=Nocardia testacea TaxID=248551 RepID=UPI000309905A|nr:helix-turn-helix transcriptional regulator [Nocardia testacea]